MLLADLHPGEMVVDLGCGDGSIVIKVAQAGAISEGYEINLFLVLWARWRIGKLGLQDKAKIYWKNMWKVDVSKYNVVVVYGFPSIMFDLKKKLQKELPVGARVISNSFPFPNWKQVSMVDQIYLYRKA